MKLTKISSYSSVGSVGLILLSIFSGCSGNNNEENKAFTEASQKQGAFVVIEEVAPNKYKIVEEYPSDTTRVILKKLDGTEQILTKEELDRLVAEEAKRIENNQSALTQPKIEDSGFGLGEAILASAAGAIIGSWIGSKLFNNQNYQQNRQQSYKSPSVFQRSLQNFSSTSSKTTSTTKKSGFFSSSSKMTSSKITSETKKTGFFTKSLSKSGG